MSTFAIVGLAVLVLVCGAVVLTWKNKQKIDAVVAEAKSKVADAEAKVTSITDALKK